MRGTKLTITEPRIVSLIVSMSLGLAFRIAKLSLESQAEQTEALQTIISEAERMREALEFYSNPENYLDGTPGSYDDAEDGTFNEDGGLKARQALRKDDIAGTPLTPIEVEALQSERA